MKKYLIDTNGLISFLTDRNIEQQKIISKYFIDASNLKCELIVLDIVIIELVYVLENVYNIKSNDIHTILKSLKDNPGIGLDSYFDFHEILKLWPDKIKDFGDTVISSYAKKNKISILTFDNKLKKELNRLKIPVQIPA